MIENDLVNLIVEQWNIIEKIWKPNQCVYFFIWYVLLSL